jgi:hypothetical protein
MARWVAPLTATALTTIAGLHVAWGFGSSFPMADRDTLADTVAGTADVPPPVACHAAAAALLAASALVLDVPVGPTWLRRTGRWVVAAVFTVRAVAGLSGRTDALVAGSESPRFRRLDRRYYAPLCLVLAAGTVAST